MNMIYNASAGTGKTYQVTQLYEELVLTEGIDPRHILLMTFTDNAAAELRMRVSHRLLKARRDAEAENKDEIAESAIQALSCLPSAPIGTIHSFCTKLLREHALETGLSPGFSTLVGDDRDELLAQICRDELLARLDSDPAFKTFCTGAQMIGTTGGFGTSITETVPALISQAGSLGISLEQAETLLPEPVSPVSIVEFSAIHTKLQDLPNPTKKVREAAKVLGQCLEQTSDPSLLITLFDRSFSGHFTYGDAKPLSKAFQELKTETAARECYRERYPAAKAFARYVQAVAVQFQQRKHAMDAVDFDDQLRRAAELLKSGLAAPEFQYVIVDEVQDTSRIQCELIQALWQPGEQADPTANPARTNLVICGDKKQSIYTWRGADPRVMPDLEAAIGERENSERRDLQISYRSKAPILDVVNTLFESVYGTETYTPGDRLLPNSDYQTPDEKPCIEFLASDLDIETVTKQEKTAAEMQAVAHRIQLLVKGSPEWQPAYRYADGFSPAQKGNTYQYSDILILLRRTAHQSVLEHALRQAHVPYTLGGKGRGLFTRQETRDVSLFLNVLTNPTDAYSLIGFLRSPWIGLSDETLAELAWSKEGFSAENLFKNYGQKTDIIDRYRELLGTKLASELVRLLIDETGFDALLAGLPRGTQRLANLRKVLDWLRENERGAQTTPATVARKLATLISDPPNVPEAALLDPAQNAVTIMTVHGSKGLTKRVVVIPDISSKAKNDTAFCRVFYDPSGQPCLGINIDSPDKNAVKSPGFKDADNRAKSVREQEQNNLLYVAMTRARDLVITSASPGKKSAGWLAQLEPLIGTDIPAIPYSVLAKAAEAPQPAGSTQPTAAELAVAVGTLMPPPKQPVLLRVPATTLAKEHEDRPEQDSTKSAVKKATELGSLGHAVLEHLALDGWQGGVEEWIERLREDFNLEKSEASTLQERIEQTRELMHSLMSTMTEVRPEFPFVIHENNSLIDGTIDLLCRSENTVHLFDYKFTEADDTSVLQSYRGQMNIYHLAAQYVFPSLEKTETHLVVVSTQGVRLLPVVI